MLKWTGEFAATANAFWDLEFGVFLLYAVEMVTKGLMKSLNVENASNAIREIQRRVCRMTIRPTGNGIRFGSIMIQETNRLEVTVRHVESS